LRAYQRGESGRKNIPTNSATAGIAATVSMTRHTLWLCESELISSLIPKAMNWPLTIISSLMVVIRPRRWAGAISDRYSGTVTEAAPTASPSTTREA